MSKITVLHFGIKNYPFDSAFANKELTGLRGGGMNKYCSLLIDSLPTSIETIIITQRLNAEKKYEFINNAHVYRLKTFGNRAFRQIITNILSFFVAFKLIKKFDIEIIHGHMQPGIFIGYYIAKILKLKIVGTPYSFTTKEGHFFLNKIAGFIESYYYKRIDKIVFETEENKKKAIDLRNLVFANSLVINTGIELPLKSFIAKPNGIGKLNLFYIGRIVKIKALNKLVLSLLHLNAVEKEQIKIDIIGEGELLKPLGILIKKHNLSEHIELHGFINDKIKYYKNCDIFILPSDMEGLSISLLEAMSYGKACIVNDFGTPFTNKELFTMDNNNPETIAKALQYFLNHKDIVYLLGKNAKKRIEKDFSIQSFSNKYANVYLQLINHNIT